MSFLTALCSAGSNKLFLKQSTVDHYIIQHNAMAKANLLKPNMLLVHCNLTHVMCTLGYGVHSLVWASGQLTVVDLQCIDFSFFSMKAANASSP